jgi:type I restriction enzyme S subunit
MGKYQGYEKYKDSGVEWLGEIPEHWKVSRAKFVSEIFVPQRNKPELNLDDGLPWLTMDDMLGDRVSQTKFKVIKEASIKAGSKTLKKGSVIASCIGNFGVCTINDVDVIINQQLQAFIPNSHIIPEYLRGLVKISNDYFQMIATAATVIYVNQAGFANMPITLPPPDEQETIARFLDYKTKQIDDLIAKKEALIEKLDEKRTALISHAVTKGLDPNVPMKDSGVEWLGKIPEHWKVIKVKYLTKILRGKFTHRPRNDPKLYDGQYPFIQTGDVANANKFIMEYTQTLNENGYAVSKEFPSGTLVMTIAANIGDMAILNFNACFPDSIVGFIPSDNTEIFFLYYLFSSMKKQFLSTAVLNTQLNLNVERISNIFTVIPPLNEQVKITNFLDKEMQKADQQKAKVQQAIDRLKEYRTALITNAVTGKIDVRQVPIP